jgi:diguanylate cyclase (GGDEF)-like protein
MTNQPNVEQDGLQARIKTEILQLEAQKKEFWILIAFSAAVLLLGGLSFFFPSKFWPSGNLQISIPPQVLFTILVALVLASLVYLRRETEVRALRLTNLQQVMTSKEEQAASMVDAVTNVFTRAFLHELLASEISRSERTNRSLTLIMCDLDNFKQVNDRYGHLMGDYVLSQMATILKSCVRGSDYIFRYGGDEFLILLPETDAKGGEIVRTRVKAKVAEWDAKNRVGDVPIAVSLGLYLHVAGQTAEKDVAEADAHMYAEKQGIKRPSSTNAAAISR